ncbi:hypothetical protein K438DRAFT_1762526 [Mycena galopus ATCC 62051]|nr:hypothetical protein K438DRAFT_1762526 [Mycena galopus ATCC 62051]
MKRMAKFLKSRWISRVQVKSEWVGARVQKNTSCVGKRTRYLAPMMDVTCLALDKESPRREGGEPRIFSAFITNGTLIFRFSQPRLSLLSLPQNLLSDSLDDALAETGASSESFALDLSVTYPVLTLPIEITSDIFLKFVEPGHPSRKALPGSENNPVNLLQICRTWRDIALAIPVLWSILNLICRLPYQCYSSSPAVDDEFIQQWLERTAGVPLSLDFQGHATEGGGQEQIKAILSRHAPDVETLDPSLDRLNFHWLVKPYSFLSLFCRLTLGSSYGNTNLEGALTFSMAPNLMEALQRHNDIPAPLQPTPLGAELKVDAATVDAQRRSSAAVRTLARFWARHSPVLGTLHLGLVSHAHQLGPVPRVPQALDAIGWCDRLGWVARLGMAW